MWLLKAMQQRAGGVAVQCLVRLRLFSAAARPRTASGTSHTCLLGIHSASNQQLPWHLVLGLSRAVGCSSGEPQWAHSLCQQRTLATESAASAAQQQQQDQQASSTPLGSQQQHDDTLQSAAAKGRNAAAADAAADTSCPDIRASLERNRSQHDQLQSGPLSFQSQLQALRQRQQQELQAACDDLEQQQQQPRPQQQEQGQRQQQQRGRPAAMPLQAVPQHTQGAKSDTEDQQQQGQQQGQQGGSPRTFTQLGVSEVLAKPLAAQGINTPTPVQVDVFPAVLTGRNLSIQSPTGTGKTLAYLLPAYHRLAPWSTHRGFDPPQPRIVVVCPGAELAVQVVKAARSLFAPAHGGVGAGAKSGACPLVGGVHASKTWQAVKAKKPMLVAGTPLQLRRFLSKNPGMLQSRVRPQPGLQDTPGSTVLVLEEVDKLANMEDFLELLPWLDREHRGQTDRQRLAENPSARHMRSILQQFQVVLVSASLRTGTLQSASSWLDTNPIHISSGPPADISPAARAAAAAAAAAARKEGGQGEAAGSGVDAAAAAEGTGEEGPAAEGASTPWDNMLPGTITHQALAIESLRTQYSQLACLMRVYVREGKKVLLFARTNASPLAVAMALQDELAKSSTSHGRTDRIKVGALYSAQDNLKRAQVLAGFHRGALDCLVTSDAFGAGLDYKDVDVVVNLHALPPSRAAYIARAGRTGRMGRAGSVVSFIPAERVPALKHMIKKITREVKEVKLRTGRSGEWVLDTKLGQWWESKRR